MIGMSIIPHEMPSESMIILSMLRKVTEVFVKLYPQRLNTHNISYPFEELQ